MVDSERGAKKRGGGAQLHHAGGGGRGDLNDVLKVCDPGEGRIPLTEGKVSIVGEEQGAYSETWKQVSGVKGKRGRGGKGKYAAFRHFNRVNSPGCRGRGKRVHTGRGSSVDSVTVKKRTKSRLCAQKGQSKARAAESRGSRLF